LTSAAGQKQVGRARCPRLVAPRRHFRPSIENLEDRTVPSYVFHTIDDPNGHQFTEPTAINDRGQIVGTYKDANNGFHGFLLSQGHYTTLDDPNAGTGPGQGTQPNAINDHGQIVGLYRDANNHNHGFLLSNGHYTTIDDPNAGPGTSAWGINDSGQIAGVYTDANRIRHGYLLSHGHYTTFDEPNAVGVTQTEAINDSGQIVGYYLDADGFSHGFLRSHGQYTTIDDPNGDEGQGGSALSGINDSGKITGFYLDPQGVEHGFLWSHGHYSTFDDPRAATGPGQGSGAAMINDSEQVVGIYIDANNAVHGYLATPRHDDHEGDRGDTDSGPEAALIVSAASPNEAPAAASAVSAVGLPPNVADVAMLATLDSAAPGLEAASSTQMTTVDQVFAAPQDAGEGIESLGWRSAAELDGLALDFEKLR
jgi:probable HAF family extracellular repeat protein